MGSARAHLGRTCLAVMLVVQRLGRLLGDLLLQHLLTGLETRWADLGVLEILKLVRRKDPAAIGAAASFFAAFLFLIF